MAKIIHKRSMELRGVLVGCDQAQEWLLPWWWENYRQENSLPVAFADFGMTEQGKEWCALRGLLQPISLDQYKIASREDIEAPLLAEWEKTLSPFWGSRQAWFKKPFALLNTPFCQTLWIDLDCEVLGNIEPAFQYIDPKSKMGLVRVTDPPNVGDPVPYNSGVIAFDKSSPLLPKWAKSSLSQNHLFLSDQHALSRIIFEESLPVGELPEIYNWLMCRGLNLSAVVMHWAAQWGKEYIRAHGGLRKVLQNFNANR